MNWQTEEIQDPAAPPELHLSISEIGDRTGLTARTIRYYEELGLLPGVRRRAGGRRVYGRDEIERLGFIARLKALGLSLVEIKQLAAVYSIAGSTHDMLLHLDELLAHHESELEQRVESLRGLRAEIGSYRAHVAQRLEALPREGRR